MGIVNGAFGVARAKRIEGFRRVGLVISVLREKAKNAKLLLMWAIHLYHLVGASIKGGLMRGRTDADVAYLKDFHR